ncbi:MAG: AAA family ATPase, partial [Rhodocyclaceae bacterium]|nr:AAA family ATPase [Rhodocyclaceae bacterium]
ENRERLRLNCAEPDNPISCFAELIQRAHEATGQRAVILIDEYDKPILDNITDSDTARAMRDGLRNFYSVIKGMDAHVKFVFLTGVSKFSKVSLFSGLNNLEDITVDARYSAICGYTETDLDTVFAAELEGADREEIRRWYNGYNWLGESVYNPFGLLLFLRNHQFKPYWFETGTPTFLVDMVAQRHHFVPDLAHLHASDSLLSTFDVDHISTEALMFQTGYLTIESSRSILGRTEYVLRYPNLEVRTAFHDVLLQTLSGSSSIPGRHISKLGDILCANNLPALRDLITAFFASIPYEWYTNNPIAQYEGYYASVFYAYFASLGLEIIPEESTNQGRLDMAVKFNNHIYLFEFKVVELTPEGSALAQLKTNDYAAKYRTLNQPIYLIGVEFSKEKRNVVGFEVEFD